MSLRRPAVNALTAAARGPRGMTRTRTTLGAVPTVTCTPLTADVGCTLLYLHGGGYALGSARAYSGLAGQIAAAMAATAILPDYRLAPENPYPAALDDALAAYTALLDSGTDPDQLVLAGDFAGGGLALALALAAREHDLPLPTSPRADLPMAGPRPRRPGRARRHQRPAAQHHRHQNQAITYADTTDPAARGISPVHGDLRGLPPIHVHTAADDPPRPDTVLLAQRCADADVPVTVTDQAGMWHVFHLQLGTLTESDNAVRHHGEALRTSLSDHMTAAPAKASAPTLP